MVKPTILALIGKPLAGKDTQADLLVEAFPAAVKISTGHILRAVREEGKTHRFWPLVGHLMPLMEAGMKLPDGPVLDMLEQVIKEQIAEGKELIVIAGSPRGEEQQQRFETIADENGARYLLAHINATDAETYTRSAARNEGRVDDTPEVHKVRLVEYDTHVRPVVERLRKTGEVVDIDGMQSKEMVFRDVETVLRNQLFDPEIRLPMMARR